MLGDLGCNRGFLYRDRDFLALRCDRKFCVMTGFRAGIGCLGHDSGFSVAIGVGLRQEIPVVTRHCTPQQCHTHGSACALDDKRPWVGRRSSFVVTKELIVAT